MVYIFWASDLEEGFQQRMMSHTNSSYCATQALGVEDILFQKTIMI